jgi:cytochrome c556
MGTNLGKRWAVAACLGLGVALLATQLPAAAQKTQGKTRPAPTKVLMKGIVFPNCSAIGKALKGTGPADDKAWEQLALNATLLNEMSYVIMDDGRCPDKVWAGAAKTLRECSTKVLDAAKAKNVEGVQTAFKGLIGACATCHKAHKS